MVTELYDTVRLRLWMLGQEIAKSFCETILLASHAPPTVICVLDTRICSRNNLPPLKLKAITQRETVAPLTLVQRFNIFRKHKRTIYLEHVHFVSTFPCGLLIMKSTWQWNYFAENMYINYEWTWTLTHEPAVRCRTTLGSVVVHDARTSSFPPPPRHSTHETPFFWVNQWQTLRTDRLVSLVNFSIFHLQYLEGFPIQIK